MILGSVARRYARALFELALESSDTDKVVEDLQDFTTELVAATDVWRMLTNPGFTKPQRRELLDQLLQRAPMGRESENFLRLLIDKGRLDHLPAIARELRNLDDQHQWRIRATVRSAVPLDAGDLTRLTGMLEQVTGKTVLMNQSVDTDLIGGMVTEVGGLMFDGSLRTQLRRMRERLVLENT